MTDITFVRTRHVYESYLDFWHLVELSGFPTIYVDELRIDMHGIFIVCPMNGEWRPHINNEHKSGRRVNAHLILWNLERPSGSAGSVGNYGVSCWRLIEGTWDETGTKTKEEDNGEIVTSHGRFIDEIWISDRRLAEETHTRFVILGSDEGLGSQGNDKKYYFAHMSYEVGRRQSIYKNFGDDKIGPNSWPPERDTILRESRFAFNVHQDQHPFQEPLRFALFAAYGLPILSEHIFDPFPWSDEFMIFSPYNGLVAKLRQMLENDYDQWRMMGNRARDRMCGEFQFGKMVRQAVKESVGDKWR